MVRLPMVGFAGWRRGEEGSVAGLRRLASRRDPAGIYGLILHHLFGAEDGDLDEERIVKSATGIRDTEVWKRLFKFQRDGVVGAIDKLERFSGCIIADSVGLNYDILNHTDLSRDRGLSGDIDLIKHKTTYRVVFDNDALIRACVRALVEAPPIPKTRLQWRKADIAIGQAGVEATETAGAATVTLDETDIELPDILTELQDRTQLTRRSIHRVLVESRRLRDFQRNPQQFIELAGKAINQCKQRALVGGIRYRKIGDGSYYAQELFAKEELTGYVRNMLDVGKSVYEKVVYESDVERDFADQLEKNQNIKVYAKLPGWFTVPTPLGSYNPDWAILMQSDEGERLYLVVETKGTPFLDGLRVTEAGKIACGEAHFKALEVQDERPTYRVATSVDELFSGL